MTYPATAPSIAQVDDCVDASHFGQVTMSARGLDVMLATVLRKPTLRRSAAARHTGWEEVGHAG